MPLLEEDAKWIKERVEEGAAVYPPTPTFLNPPLV